MVSSSPFYQLLRQKFLFLHHPADGGLVQQFNQRFLHRLSACMQSARTVAPAQA